MINSDKNQVWNINECAVFCKSADEWGCFGNMSGGFPFTDPETSLSWKNSEAWYQAQKFPDNLEIREKIRNAVNGYIAKKVAYEYKDKVRSDWFEINYKIMKKAIELKAQNNNFKMMLIKSANKNIVELSYRDNYYGAKPSGNTLVGANVLGQLLMLVRSDILNNENNENLNKPRGMMAALRGE